MTKLKKSNHSHATEIIFLILPLWRSLSPVIRYRFDILRLAIPPYLSLRSSEAPEFLNHSHSEVHRTHTEIHVQIFRAHKHAYIYAHTKG